MWFSIKSEQITLISQVRWAFSYWKYPGVDAYCLTCVFGRSCEAIFKLWMRVKAGNFCLSFFFFIGFLFCFVFSHAIRELESVAAACLSSLVAWMPKVLLWVVWLSLCFAHIVRLVMPHSKRLPLSRGYLIVRGRRCFQESFFSWPIKVAVISGIRRRNLPFLLGSHYYRILLIVEIISPSLLYPRRWSVLFVLFDWAERTGQKYVQMLCISG